jgi:hypothetical protein
MTTCVLEIAACSPRISTAGVAETAQLRKIDIADVTIWPPRTVYGREDTPARRAFGAQRGSCLSRQKRGRIVMTTINRSSQQDRDRKTIAGISKYLSKTPAIVVAGTSYTPEALTRLFQDDILFADKATQAKAAFHAAATAARDQRTRMRPILIGFRAFLLNAFADPAIVAEFGFSPRKAAKPTAGTKAAAAKKSRATRTARHTMGSKQKKAIKGDVSATPPVAATPPGTPPAAAPSTAMTPPVAAPPQGTTPHAS